MMLSTFVVRANAMSDVLAGLLVLVVAPMTMRASMSIVSG